jgi:hypothetical protein
MIPPAEAEATSYRQIRPLKTARLPMNRVPVDDSVSARGEERTGVALRSFAVPPVQAMPTAL